ncbi:glycerophosphodiester phosphodiesterase [Sulfurimonas xiamenensis]|jgi:glycerophosphoryl diester phosphodiesterase|uniref:Glycerophosphodiester phosphodiesterase n=1 Tax=Sulfurimonas xiamenensis TaxID=2590021 RepID=A0AAJ4A3V1_9BACT|nr:glycerophosphodiester phosphodiesterase family protein [Sulfurimonas xiamenensis]QFR43410.1 glycerophosphodiester phosphodiesterase [Sulfurimonas xiamenensis]
MKFLELMKKKGLVAAHRGARSIAPENTLSALKKSIGKCDFIEIDVQLSKDRTVIVMHDNTLQRTTNIAEIDSFRDKKPYRVCDFMFEELCMLDYGSWFYKYKNHKEPLLTLKRALEFIKENSLFINIEIKDMSNCFEDRIVIETIAKEIEEAGVQERVLISSFRHEYLIIVKEKLPNVPSAALVEGRDPDNLLEYLKSLKVDAYHIDNALVDKTKVKMLRETGFFVGVYTVNNPQLAKELFEIGVNYIFSDCLNKKLKVI